MRRGILIDTSAWIEAMRPKGEEPVRAKVHAALREGRARLCDFVRLELWNGVGGEAERRWLAELEATVESVPTNLRVWAEARKQTSEARHHGLTVPASDHLIAACARVHDLDLLHRDTHFDRLETLVKQSLRPTNEPGDHDPAR